MPARIVEAERDQVLHALLLHVAERHRRAACVSLSRSRKKTSVLGTWRAAEAMWIARWPGVTPSSSLGSVALRRLGAPQPESE